MGVFMEQKKRLDKPDATGEKRRFPRLKGMVERIKSKAYVLAVVGVSALAMNGCGGPTETGDGGHDAGTVTDSGDGGTTTDGGQSLCEQYPEGHANRLTFNLGLAEAPSEDCSEYVLMFRELMDLGGDMRAVFAYLNTTTPSSAEFIGFNVGDQATKDVPAVGETTFELCSTTSLTCKYQFTGPHLGDTDCTATLASTRAWCSE